MSFSHDVKLEILNKKRKEKQFLNFIKGLVFCNCKINEKKEELIIKINKEDISLNIKEKLSKFNIKYYRSPKNKNWIVILKNSIDLSFQIEDPIHFFAGSFVGGGTISDINSTSYNLQISFFEKEVGELLLEKLNVHFSFSQIKRNDKYFLYEKKGENILNFLNAIGALKSFTLFFDQKNIRDIENNANRLANLDIHNQQRLVEAAQRDIANFSFLKANNLLDKLNEDQITFFEIRTKDPLLNLNEISDILKDKYQIIKTKSGLNHWSIKLNKLIEKYKKID
ncbi:DNA-binding protein WhiA [Mesomycoplasma molare]|uniref:DNA-binding protein WhiA n=1 Tax=Mesomycoplasma molare TaxID=171288 RepID=A0ABY5TUB8_9BACT|nr:DNA-binding protein WhiA [Mesomycoplasma molare]UWD34264.1 DNA-binding protein WhiA [Mesomycoplasma molare]